MNSEDQLVIYCPEDGLCIQRFYKTFQIISPI